MLKALKKGIKKLGSGSKLHEAVGAPDEAAAAAPAAAAPKVAHVHPPGLPRPPSPLVHQQQLIPQQQPIPQQHAQPPPPQPQPGPAGALPAAAAAAEGGARPASPPMHEELGGGMVDYELVAGPLELDTAEDAEAPDGAGCSYTAAEAAAGGAEQHPAEGAEQLPSLCYGSGDQSGSLAAAAAAQDEEAAAAAAAAVHSGGGDDDVGAAAADGAAAAAGAAAGGGDISEALAAMMYLTEDAEGNDDCVSVVSGGCWLWNWEGMDGVDTEQPCSVPSLPSGYMYGLRCPATGRTMLSRAHSFAAQAGVAYSVACPLLGCWQMRSATIRTFRTTSASCRARWRRWRERLWPAPAQEVKFMGDAEGFDACGTMWCCCACLVPACKRGGHATHQRSS